MGTRRTVVALGLFDGVHLGHRSLLDLALMKKRNDMDAAIFTFCPDAVLEKRGVQDGFIYPFEQKQQILEGCGFDEIYSPHFSELRDMSGEEFVRKILVDKMRAAAVCCGEDFRFGSKAACGVDELKEFGRKYGFEVHVAKTLTLDGEVVSSGKIRRFLAEGDIRSANLFLDAPYTISKEVSRGAQIGRTIGFPTANQVFDKGQLVPRFGVYASEVYVCGRCYRAVTDIGMKPTVDYGGMPLAETYIDGFSQDIYDTVMQVRLLDFIRPEKHFSSLDELKEQIRRDAVQAGCHINVSENSQR